MARSLNQLYQFMQAQRINSPIERVFLAGIDREDLGYYGQTIREQGTDVTCEMVDTGFGSGTGLQYESGNALFAVSGLFDQGPDSNFLTNFSMKKSADSAFDNRIKKYVLLIAAVFVVMFVVFLVTLGLRLVRSAKLKELQDYNDTVAPQAMFYDMEALRRDELSAKYNSINSVVQTIESYPVGSDEVISILERTAQGYAQIEISSFDANAGKISFTATSQNVNDIYKYIDRLLEEDIFQSVEHTGYTYDSSKDCYNIYVDCTLAESAGRKLKEDK